MKQQQINKKDYSSVFSTNTTLVIGILNITNDSFYDGGKFVNNTQIITQCKKMLDEGATVIEIGAQSSKPGAIQISSKDELKKLLPTIKLLKNTFKEIILSIDTFWSNTAKACILEGADMINDISAGNIDKDIFKVIAKYNVPYIIMHMKGTPKNMQDKPEYNNVVDEIIEYFIEKITTLNSIGIKKIIIDPGFGFGKTINHNFKILNNLDKLKHLKCPILVGVSRKSMIYNLLKTTPHKALNGTSVLNTIALGKGANVLRVHDVKEAIECIKISTFAKNNF